METTTNNCKTLAALTHLSALSQYFFPLGNFILPVVIWSVSRRGSEFVDDHGKQAINFQLSIFLYSLVLAIIAIPILLFTIFKNVPFSVIADGGEFAYHLSPANITGIVIIAAIAVMLFILLKVAEFFLIIFASVRAANGEPYNYPFSIKFIK